MTAILLCIITFGLGYMFGYHMRSKIMHGAIHVDGIEVSKFSESQTDAIMREIASCVRKSGVRH